MEQVRCFIAIGLPEQVRAGLKELQARLKSGGPAPVKWVDPYSIHLTLKFLGNISPKTVPQIVEAVTGAAQSVSPLHLQVGGLGAFPNMNRPQVVWVGIGGEVEKLASQLRWGPIAHKRIHAAPPGPYR